MLHEFLTANREELVRRCLENEAKRAARHRFPDVIDTGIPMFLQQLTETLRHEHMTQAGKFAKTDPAPLPQSIGRAAALHGAKLLRLGYTVDQVVRDYGD